MSANLSGVGHSRKAVTLYSCGCDSNLNGLTMLSPGRVGVSVFMAFPSSSGCGLWDVAAVTAARVIVRALTAKDSARVLPRLAALVPMEAELRKRVGDGLRLLLPECNPNPLPDNMGDAAELRGFGLKQLQKVFRWQLAVAMSQREIQLRQFAVF